MVRKTYSAIAVIAIAAMSIVGCGKENVADLNDNWTKAENDLNSKLTEVKNEHSEILNKFQMVQTADITDSVKLQDRKTVDQMIQDHEKAVGEIEAKANDLKAKRDELMKSPKRADFEAAWNAAKADYDAANAKLDELKSQDSDMKSKIDGLGSGSTKPADTTAAHSGTTSTGKDTMVLEENSKMKEGSKMEGTKMEKKDTAAKTSK
jgi:hypothetical protein